ncbi:MAG: hypothetical protein QM762_03955 [Chryseolinea sp.]
MRKLITPHICILLISALILIGCDDDHSNNEQPKLKTIGMSYGDHHYSVLHYDERDRIVRVVHGLIDEDKDSVETLFHVIYSGANIQRIIASDESQAFRYVYNDGKLVESWEYANSQVVSKHSFIYNDAGQVDAWITKGMDGENEKPVSRKFYSYDGVGNATSMESESYDPTTRGYALVATSLFLDFDSKKNTASLFLNFINPYHVPFRNNARVWRVENSNGSVGETTYEYEYNADGYATSQRDVDGEFDILYHFNLP